MNARELAEALGVHPETVRRMIRDGEIEAERYSREYIVPDHEVRRLLHISKVSERHQEVVRSSYVLAEQTEVVLMSRISRLLAEGEELAMLRREYFKLVGHDPGSAGDILLQMYSKGEFDRVRALVKEIEDLETTLKTIKKISEHSEELADRERFLRMAAEEGWGK